MESVVKREGKEVCVKVDRHYTRRQTWAKEAAPDTLKLGSSLILSFLKGMYYARAQEDKL